MWDGNQYQEYIHELLTPEKFLAFVEQYGDDVVIGLKAKECECPLAFYMNHALEYGEGESVAITDEEFFSSSNHSNTHIVELPEWAKLFITAIDNQDRSDAITALDCQDAVKWLMADALSN